MIITNQNTDVDTGFDGKLCAALPRDDTPGDLFGFYGDSITLIPRSEWNDRLEAFDYEGYARKLNTFIYRQTMGSCATNATCNIHQRLQAQSKGSDSVVLLSPLSLYKRTGRSPNSGSTLSGNMREATQRGMLPLDGSENRGKFDHVWPENEWRSSLPSGWESTAADFKLDEFFEARSFDEVFTALLNTEPVFYGRAGHAIMGAFPARNGNTYGIGYENSWGSSWGDGGYGFDTERFVSGSFGSYGCYIPRSIKRFNHA